MKKYNWFKVFIEPHFPPLCISNYCGAESFFVRCSEGKFPTDKAVKYIRQLCKNNLFDAFYKQGGSWRETPDNVEALKTFLVRHGHDTDIEDITLDNVADTGLYFHFEQIYKIVSIENASSCEACRLQEGGQDAHMEYGGCLYDPDNEI